MANARKYLPLALLAPLVSVFLPGIQWGLPSRAADRYLFGDRSPWSAEEIQFLAGARPASADQAADVDVNPVARSTAVQLNDTDARRAEIVRRYRLYSYQPDEMNTLMALASMRPGAGDLDPKMYKYGGLWVYPVAAILKAGDLLGLLEVRSDPAFYLEQPEAFGRFYVAARLYTVAWAVLGVWAVYAIARRGGAGRAVAMVAGACFSLMPVVVNSAHEAKPHLPGAVLTLLAVLAGSSYVSRGGRRRAAGAGALCGAAAGMVLSAAIAFLILPVMVLLRPSRWERRRDMFLLSMLAGVCVYAITNPYVPINLFRRPELLRSHFTNSADFYQFGAWADALPNGALLLAAGATPVLLIAGFLAAAVTGGNALRRRREPPAVVLLLGAVAVVGLVQFFAFAAGQPGDYGRFALLPNIAIALAAVCGAGAYLKNATARRVVLAVLVGGTALHGLIYVAGFVRDSKPLTSRLLAAEHIARMPKQYSRIVTPVEPAPFSLPPVNLFSRRIVLAPRSQNLSPQATDLLVRPVDVARQGTIGGTVRTPLRWVNSLLATRLSWADKPFAVTAGDSKLVK